MEDKNAPNEELNKKGIDLANINKVRFEEDPNQLFEQLLSRVEKRKNRDAEMEKEMNEDIETLRQLNEYILQAESKPDNKSELEIQSEEPANTPDSEGLNKEEGADDYFTTIKSGDLKEDLVRLQEEYDKIPFWKPLAQRRKTKEIEAKLNAYKYLKSKEEKQKKDKEEIEKDEKAKPLLYFAANKITNENLKQLFVNKNLNTLDLRFVEDPANYEREYNDLIQLDPNNKNEGFFYFNLYGFIKMIKNVPEIRSKEGINSGSPEALYKIVSPDGTIIADDIKGYEEADQIYYKATEEYKKKTEEEFKNTHK